MVCALTVQNIDLHCAKRQPIEINQLDRQLLLFVL
jgi:hypothetical protein